jgi:membrane associated rhomboid family serine protease
MGLYDRDYVRDQPRGFFLGGDRSMVVNLILVNVGLFLVDALFTKHDEFGHGGLSGWMAVNANLFHQPWNAWQLLTCGFAHDPVSPLHVAGNMFMLWLFGRDVETIYGRKEFLWIYLTMIVVAALAWVVSMTLQFRNVEVLQQKHMLGASGAVAGIMILNVIHFPRRVFYFWGVVPLPAWLLATLYVGQDMLGYNSSLRGQGEGIAFEAHLAGAAFAFLYHYTGWNFGKIMPGRMRISSNMLKRRPKLRLHEPPQREEDLSRQVDRILEKISREGEASLTQAERRTLEEASRRYQQRKQ